MQQEFKDSFDALNRYQFDNEYGKDLVKSILAIRMPTNARENDSTTFNKFQSDWFRLDGYIESLYKKYANRLGDNAYAALQAATDLASHPIQNLCLRRDKHALQLLAGEWLVDFKTKCKEQDFDLSEYLARPVYDHEKEAKSNRHT